MFGLLAPPLAGMNDDCPYVESANITCPRDICASRESVPGALSTFVGTELAMMWPLAS